MLTCHHLFSITGCAIGLYGGYALPGISNAVIFIEITTIFLNYRGLSSKESMNSGLPYYNNLAFALSFTVLRVLSIPMWLYIEAKNFALIWDHIDTYRRLATLWIYMQSWGLMSL